MFQASIPYSASRLPHSLCSELILLNILLGKNDRSTDRNHITTHTPEDVGYPRLFVSWIAEL